MRCSHNKDKAAESDRGFPVARGGFLFMEEDNARIVEVHQQELLKQFLQCSVLTLHFFIT